MQRREGEVPWPPVRRFCKEVRTLAKNYNNLCGIPCLPHGVVYHGMNLYYIRTWNRTRGELPLAATAVHVPAGCQQSVRLPADVARKIKVEIHVR